MYGLADCNNFFASCERVFDPSLEGRPIVVLSSNDGCVIARSNEAKALGIKMCQPFFQIRALAREANVAVFSSNYSLYSDMSDRVMQTLRQLAPSVEVYSIDEAFLSLDTFALDELTTYGRSIARTVRRNIGIPISLGIAPTKTLAKVASRLCKQYPKLEGCCLMHRDEDVAKVLDKLPIGEVWGIGRRSVAMLNGYGIRTAGQFCRLSPDWVQGKMSVTGLRTYKELHGEPCIEYDDRASDKQSITVSRSFAHELTDLESLNEALITFVSMAAEKLRNQGSVVAQMSIYILTNRHREDQPQHYENRIIRFDTPTDSTLEMASAAASALGGLFRPGYRYKKAGVTLLEISSSDQIQSQLFDPIDREKHKALMTTIDSLNSAHGRSTIMLASQAATYSQTTHDHLSPRYTTNWDEIMTIKC